MSEQLKHYQEGFVSERRGVLLSTERRPEDRVVVPFSEVTPQLYDKVGGKGKNLAILAQAGLPVPPGAIITTDAFVQYQSTGELPAGLITEAKRVKAELGGKVALRSSATLEDGLTQSMAGVFSSHYLNGEDLLEAYIRAIYDQADSAEVTQYLQMQEISHTDVQMAIVEQQLVDSPEFSGVVYTGVNGADLLVQYVDGYGEVLVDGQTHGSAVLFDPETQAIHASQGYELRPLPLRALEQLGEYVGVIEELFQNGEQDIEFAYKEGQIYILQARPLTTELGDVSLEQTAEGVLEDTRVQLRSLMSAEKTELKTETVVLTDSNFSELLPRPTEMDFGIFAAIFTGTGGQPGAIQLGRREMGYTIPEHNLEFLHYVGGRPYFSLSLDAETFYTGFPATEREYLDTLVAEYLQAVTADPMKGSYPEMGLYVQDPTLRDLRERFGDRAEEYYERYTAFASQMAEQAHQFKEDFFTEELPRLEKFITQASEIDLSELSAHALTRYSSTVLEHLRTVSCVDFVKAARLGFYYSQRLQQELTGLVGEEQQELYFAKLSQGLEGSMITQANIQIAEAATDDEALVKARILVGHFSTKEMLEVRHPRLSDDEEALRAYVGAIRRGGVYTASFSEQAAGRKQTERDLLAMVPDEQKAAFVSIMQSSQTYMALRETVKYHFVREYALIRKALEELNHRLSQSEGAIYHLYPHELPLLEDQLPQMQHFISARKQAFEKYDELDLPSVIREQDVDGLDMKHNGKGDFVELKGKFLAEGEPIEGMVINLDDCEGEEQLEEAIQVLKKEGVPIILAAQQMTLGHDPYIAQADGLILMNAGIVSHGAQRARELGTGAIGGINTSRLPTGLRICFDPKTRTIRRVAS